MLEMAEGTTAYEAVNAMMIISFCTFVCLTVSVVHSQTDLEVFSCEQKVLLKLTVRLVGTTQSGGATLRHHPRDPARPIH